MSQTQQDKDRAAHIALWQVRKSLWMIEYYRARTQASTKPKK